MNRAILVINMLFTFTSKHYGQIKEKDIITTSVEIIAKDANLPEKKCANAYFTRLSITNNQDTAISFYIMSCSWELGWFCNNKDAFLYFGGCDSNIPIQVKLKPNEFIAFYGIICSSQKSTSKKKLRFGFKLLDWGEVQYVNSEKAREILAEKKTYWSNEIILENTLLYNYKINGKEKLRDEF